MIRKCLLIAIVSLAALIPWSAAPSAAPNEETTGPSAEPKDLPIELKFINARKEAYEVKTRGDPAFKYEERIREAEKARELLSASQVDMELEIKNTGSVPITIWIDGESVALNLELIGPGAVTATVKPGVAQKSPTAIKIQPGKSYRMPLKQLECGSRDERTHAYITKAGSYSISATLRTGVFPAPSGAKKILQKQFGEVILKSAPMEFRVVRAS